MPRKGFNDYLRVNKRHWDAIAKRDRTEKADMLRQIRDDTPYLEKWEPKLGPYLKHIKGKKIIVPQFGDGLVMLACAKKGAIVTGVDLSSEQVRSARKAAEYCGVTVELVEADWQNLPESIPNDHFDLVVTECGIFIWINDLDAWMKNAYRVLRNRGKLVVTDFHPFSIITEQVKGEIVVKKSYFDQGHGIENLLSEENEPPAIEFLWKLSDIINAAINAGFRIDRVEEFYVEPKVRWIRLVPTDFLIAASKE